MALTVEEQIQVLKAICRIYTVGMNFSSLLEQIDQISQQTQNICTVSILDFLKEHFDNTTASKMEGRSDDLLKESTKNVVSSMKDRPRRGGRFIKVTSADVEEESSTMKTSRSKRNQLEEQHGDEPSSVETGSVVSSPAKRPRKSSRR